MKGCTECSEPSWNTQPLKCSQIPLYNQPKIKIILVVIPLNAGSRLFFLYFYLVLDILTANSDQSPTDSLYTQMLLHLSFLERDREGPALKGKTAHLIAASIGYNLTQNPSNPAINCHHTKYVDAERFRYCGERFSIHCIHIY